MQERKRRRLLKQAGKLDVEDLTFLLARRVQASRMPRD